jgi:hypothetical protein
MGPREGGREHAGEDERLGLSFEIQQWIICTNFKYWKIQLFPTFGRRIKFAISKESKKE